MQSEPKRHDVENFSQSTAKRIIILAPVNLYIAIMTQQGYIKIPEKGKKGKRTDQRQVASLLGASRYDAEQKVLIRLKTSQITKYA